MGSLLLLAIVASFTLLSWLLGAPLVLKAMVTVGCLVQLAGTLAVALHARGRGKTDAEEGSGTGDGAGFLPPLSILKPVKGLDDGAYESFSSHCRQDHPDYEVVFCVQDPRDPVIPVIKRVIRNHPDCDARLIVDPVPVWANGKVANLHNGLAAARHEYLLMTDSDVRVDPGFARRMLRPLVDPEVGLAFAPPIQRGIANAASGFEAVTMNHDRTCALALYDRLKGLDWAFGAAIAMRRGLLERELGGFERMKDVLAEDHRTGLDTASLGYKVHVVREPVSMVGGKAGWREVFSHIFRWSRTQRLVAPGTFHLLPLGYAVAPAVVLTIISPAAFGWLLGAVAVRLLSVVLTDLLYIREPSLYRYLWLVPLKDLVSPVVWAASYLGNNVMWRGRRLRVGRDGSVLEVRPAPPAVPSDPIPMAAHLGSLAWGTPLAASL